MKPTPGPGQALVIGATGAVGGAVLRRLREAGVTVVAIARDASGLHRLADDDGGIVACPADIGSDSCGSLISAAIDRVGAPVRMIVQAAGLPPSGHLGDIEPAMLGTLVALKLGGLIRALRAVDHRLEHGSRIVAVGGHFGSEPSPRTCGAGVTNAALANLVRQLADAYGTRGITAHLLAPGPLETERLYRLAEIAAQDRGVDVGTVLDEYRAHSSMGRLTTVEEVAWAVAMLLEPEAAALQGATLALDSGARRGIF